MKVVVSKGPFNGQTGRLMNMSREAFYEYSESNPNKLVKVMLDGYKKPRNGRIRITIKSLVEAD